MGSEKTKRSTQSGTAGAGAVYGLGLIGALVYFIGHSYSGWDYVLALPKAVFWPAIVVYELLESFYS